MPKFLNNIDLNSNQLLSPVIHVSSQSTATNGPAGNATGTEGQIFYNSHAKALYFRDDSAWRPIGDISGVSAGVGLSGGGTGGDVTLTIDFSEFSDVTPVNGDKLATLDSDGSTEQLTTIASLATLFAGSNLTATNSVIAVDTAAIADGGAKLATADQIHTFVTGASTSGNAATVTTNANLTGHITSVGNAAVLGSFTAAQLNTAISNATLSGNNTGDQTLPTDFVSAANGGTFSGGISMGDNNISNVGIIAVDEIQADNTSIKIGDQASKTVTLGRANTTTTNEAGENVDTSPSVQTAVSVLGDLAVAGNLTISGDLTTVSTSNTAIKDTIIVLNAGHTGSQTKDIAVLFERGSETNVAFRWDEDQATFDLIATPAAGNEATGAILKANPNNNGENAAGTAGYQNLRVNAIAAPGGLSGALTGNASTATKIATITNANIVQKTETQTLTNKTLTSPTLTSPALGTPASGTLTNCTFPTLNQNTSGTAGSISGITNANIVQKVETQTLTNKTLTSPVLNTGVSGTAIKDEDDMTSNSATHLATQQSIKAYVDAQTSGDSNTGGRQAFVLNNSVAEVAATNSDKTYTITHGMGDGFNYGVEVIRNSANSGGGETVYTDVTRTTTTIVIDFAAAPTAGNFTALVCKY